MTQTRINYLNGRIAQKNKQIFKLQNEVGYWRSEANKLRQKFEPLLGEDKINKRNSYYKLMINRVSNAIRVEYPDFCDAFLITTSRKREICEQRQVFMYIMRLKNISCKFIGSVCGGKDHSTVLHAATNIQDLMDTDKHFRKRIERILERLNQIEQ